MEHYDVAAGVERFPVARNTFDCLVGQLTDPQTMKMPHDRLEEALAEQGHELLRLLLQAHLDLRADRERAGAERLRGTGTAMTGADGMERRRLENGHHRLLATVLGTVTITRCAWRAPAIKNLYPTARPSTTSQHDQIVPSKGTAPKGHPFHREIQGRLSTSFRTKAHTARGYYQATWV